jgi:hypothetical protein
MCAISAFVVAIVLLLLSRLHQCRGACILQLLAYNSLVLHPSIPLLANTLPLAQSPPSQHGDDISRLYFVDTQRTL